MQSVVALSCSAGRGRDGRAAQASKQTNKHSRVWRQRRCWSGERDSGEGQLGGVVDARGDQPMMELAWVAVGDGAL